MQTITAYKGKVWWLTFSSDGAYLASAGSGLSVSLWDLASGKSRRLQGGGFRPQGLTFAPHGPALAAVCASTVRLWPDPGQQPRTIITRVGYEHVFRPDGEILAYRLQEFDNHSGLTVLLRFFDTVRGDPADLCELSLPFSLYRLTWSPTARMLAGIHYETQTSRRRIHLLPLEAGAVPQLLRDLPPEAGRLSFSPDGSTLVTHTNEAILRWDLQGVPLPVLKGHRRMINGVAYLPDGRLVSCSNDGTTRLWDGVSGKCLDVRDWQLGELTTLAVARDGMRAAVGSKTGTILVWDID
jgi:WD40 repeat protein